MLWGLNFARQLTALNDRGMDLPVSVGLACNRQLGRSLELAGFTSRGADTRDVRLRSLF